MITCPLCEHQQEFGLECEACGKDLGALGALGPPPARDEPLEGLERQELVGDVASEPLLDLELTPYQRVEVAAEVTPELERTAVEPVGEVPVEPMIDLSHDRANDTDPRTPMEEGPVTCRYCRHVQPPQRLCERCGMSLPSRAVAAPSSASVRVPEVRARCRFCGAPALAGQRCGDCGREVPLER